MVLRPGAEAESAGWGSRDSVPQGKATVFSKALVEANRKLNQEQDGSQGVGLVFPVGGKPGARA